MDGPAGGQRDVVSPPLHSDGGRRRRADSAGQHDRLANQSLHGGRVGLIDGHFTQGQTEEEKQARRKEGKEGGGEHDGGKQT